MKSPGIIYRKYRQLKKFFMYQEWSIELKKTHNNCIYCHNLSYTDKKGIERKIPICTLKELTITKNIETCNNPAECLYFSYKKSKEKIKEDIITKFSDLSYIKKNYPELYLLEWILDNDLEKAKKKNNIFTIIIIKLIQLLEKLIKL